MKNRLLKISDKWEIKRDEFYEINPFDSLIKEDEKITKLYCQEDLLWIKNKNYNLDLGWYREQAKGHFVLYLYRGDDWHNCELLEKRKTKNYNTIIELINNMTRNVESGKYDCLKVKNSSIDDYPKTELIFNFQTKNK